MPVGHEASLSDPTGLFSFDTRFLSKWVLRVNGQRLNALSTDDLQYFEARFFLVVGTGTVYVDADLSVIRRRTVAAGFEEELIVLNHTSEHVDLELRLDADCDFADLFEVKDALQKKGSYHRSVEDDCLVLRYERETFRRATRISTTAEAGFDENGLTLAVALGPHGRWTTEIQVEVSGGGMELVPRSSTRTQAKRADKMAKSLKAWLSNAPNLESDSDSLRATYHRSLVTSRRCDSSCPFYRVSFFPLLAYRGS